MTCSPMPMRRPGEACGPSLPGREGPRICRACWRPRRWCRCSVCRCRASICRVSIRCTRSSRCPRAFRWRRSRSGRRARPMRRCSRSRCWPAKTHRCASACWPIAQRQTEAARAMTQDLAPVTLAACRCAPWRRASATLGVLGGGQLGRMFVHAAQVHRLPRGGARARPGSPAGAAADEHRRAAYPTPPRSTRIALACAAVTTEFENVPASALRRLAAHAAGGAVGRRGRGLPAPRAREALLRRGGRALRAVCAARARRPKRCSRRWQRCCPASSRRASLGYDGKGQRRGGAAGRPACGLVRPAAACPACSSSACRCAHEISVIVARGRDGQTVHLPVQQNLHRDGILARDPGACARRRCRDRSARDRRSRAGWRMRSITSACCASSSSCSKTARWWPTRWRRGRTTRATTASTPATYRSSTCRCARWPGCRWSRRACIRLR